MKKFSALMLAAAMMLSMAGCSETEDGDTEARDIAVVSQNGAKGTDIAVKKDPDPDTDPKGKDILTPPTTEAQDLAKSDYSAYSFFSKAEDHSDPNAPKYYKGEIVDDAAKQRIFQKLCTVLRRNELSLAGKTSVALSNNILTLKNANGDEYRISECFIGYDDLTEEGTPAYYFTAPHSVLCFEADTDEMDELKDLIGKAVMTEENLIAPDGGDTVPVKVPDGAAKPEFPLTYISVRSNFAWGRHISGSFFDARGHMYTFDLSDDLEKSEGQTEFKDVIYKNLMNGRGKITSTGVYTDTSLINEGMKYAARIDPDLKFKEEHLMCDYGQNTLYAVVDGTLVMLKSRGDVDMTSDDGNVLNAIRCFNDAMSKSEGIADICE